MKTRLVCSLLLGLCCLLGGCSSKANVESRESVGQELQDLEAARDQGLITESEYQKQRNKILNRK
jgi:hypothetical protein